MEVNREKSISTYKNDSKRLNEVEGLLEKYKKQ